jgi:hypothetical protein
MSIIVAITPGNIGIAEWGWVGLLSLVGISTYDAGYFAIISTVLGYGSTIAVFTGILMMFFLWKLCRFAGI